METTQDTWGHVVRARAIFRDAEGRTLLTTALPAGSRADEADRTRVQKAIRARPPKPVDGAWERELV